MTTQEIISMAREAGMQAVVAETADAVERFAKLVAEKEREACAKLADVWVRAYDHPSEAIARSIRERNNND